MVVSPPNLPPPCLMSSGVVRTSRTPSDVTERCRNHCCRRRALLLLNICELLWVGVQLMLLLYTVLISSAWRNYCVLTVHWTAKHQTASACRSLLTLYTRLNINSWCTKQYFMWDWCICLMLNLRTFSSCCYMLLRKSTASLSHMVTNDDIVFYFMWDWCICLMLNLRTFSCCCCMLLRKSTASLSHMATTTWRFTLWMTQL